MNKKLSLFVILFFVCNTAIAKVENQNYIDGLRNYISDFLQRNKGKIAGLKSNVYSDVYGEEDVQSKYITQIHNNLVNRYTDQKIKDLRDNNPTKFRKSVEKICIDLVVRNTKQWHKDTVNKFVDTPIRIVVERSKAQIKELIDAKKESIEAVKKWYKPRIDSGEKTKAHLKGRIKELVDEYDKFINDIKKQNNDIVERLKTVVRKEIDELYKSTIESSRSFNFPNLSNHLSTEYIIRYYFLNRY